MSHAAERHRSPWTTKQKIGRLLWAVVQCLLFRTSFHNWYGWRRFLLRCFGAGIGRDCVIRRTARIECPWNLVMGDNACLGDRAVAYCLGTVTIGARASVSQDAELCAGTHDADRASMPLVVRPVVIGEDVWLAAGSFVGPGVTVGDGAILGARGVAMRDLDAWTVYAGNPAVELRRRDQPAAD